jgi:hypothetical protein
VSFSVVSLMAMVPDSECRTPILIVSSADAAPLVSVKSAGAAHFNIFPVFIVVISS